MNTESSVKEIADLTRQGLQVEVEGKTYTSTPMRPVFYDPRPAPLELRSLTGLLDYLRDNIDGCDLSKCAIHVKSHEEVALITDVRGISNERNTPAVALLDDVERYQFGKWIGHEEFCIQLRSRFVPTDDLARVLAIVGKIDVESSVKLEDDGVSQHVTVKKGISGGLKEEAPAPVTVSLQPYRTFVEIEQPVSAFLFRIRQTDEGVKCALFEADGGRWRGTARASIRSWFARAFSSDTAGGAQMEELPAIIA